MRNPFCSARADSHGADRRKAMHLANRRLRHAPAPPNRGAIGTPTVWGVLPSLRQLLQTGGVLTHVISNFQTPNGVVLEGRGVLPDITATLSRKAVLAGRDPARERAIEFIKASK